MKVNKRELLQFLGRTNRTVDQWIDKGLPYKTRADRKKNIDWEFETKEVIDWLRDYWKGGAQQPVADDAKQRKLNADAEMAETELAKYKGQLVDAEAVEEQWLSLVTRCKTKLLGMPSKLAYRLSALDSKDEINELLDDEIRQALEELSGSDDDETEANS